MDLNQTAPKTPPRIYNAEVRFGVPMALLRKCISYLELPIITPFEEQVGAKIGWLAVTVYCDDRADLIPQLMEFGPAVLDEKHIATWVYFEPLPEPTVAANDKSGPSDPPEEVSR